ncbi:MAG: sulfotransferase [Candidatus Omnitrophica bacterium]|nr:sulfotransferase [Candidatus Omnitrophota bacterium]MDD5670792.1 sulfotransferase [Candidatus Omnitrophota bacterium]
MKPALTFLEKENDLRVTKYRKSPSDEAFLRELQKKLKNFEQGLRDETETQLPNIYILGLPRSGTTLLSQVLAHCLDVAWVTNLMARFWEVPVVGLRLSRLLGLFDQGVKLSSDYAVTDGINGPHEFGYFWLKWFLYPGVQIQPREIESRIDWGGLRKTLGAMNAEVRKPMIYKNSIPAFHLKKFYRIQKKSIFIFMSRDLADVGVSIYHARIRRYGAPDRWWSFRPQNYKTLSRLKPLEQIQQQIMGLGTAFEREIQGVPQSRLLFVDYRELCRSPMKVVERVRRCLENPKGIPDVRAKVAPLKFRTHRSQKLYREFKNLLNHTSLI